MTDLFDARLAAFGNPTRRAILQLAARRERSAGELASAFSITRPAVSQHIRILVHAGLLVERRDRQHHLYRADAAAVEAFRRQFDKFWASGLAQLKAVVESDTATDQETRRQRKPRSGRRHRG